MHCGGVPVSKWRKPLVKNGAMLVGDAACQVNALSGGGIAYALFAGRVAGETAAEAKKNDGFDYSVLRRYQKRWESYCGKQQLRSFALKSMLLEKNNDHFYDSIALELSKERPERLSYTRVFMRTFARHPGILLKTFLLFR
jgi:digeranylgeranylglycerophospholipid reductase